MPLERPHGRHEDHCRGVEPGRSALDVEELLRPEIETETGFGDRPLGMGHGHLRRDDGVATVGYVGEGPAMHEGGDAFTGLDQVRQDGVLEDDHHGADRIELTGGHGLVLPGERDEQPGEPVPQIVGVLGQTERRHDLRRRSDVEARLPGNALQLASQTDHGMSQGPIVEVDHPSPENPPRVDPENVLLVDVVVHHRRQEIIGRGNGVEIPGEMQIDVGRRHQDRLAAAGGTPLHAEGGTEGGLPQGQTDVDALLGHPLGQTDRRGRLALTRARRGNGGNEDQLARLAAGVPRRQPDLGLVVAVGHQILAGDAQIFCYFRDGTWRRRECHLSFLLAGLRGAPRSVTDPGETS